MIVADLLARPEGWALLLAAPLAWLGLVARDRARARRLRAIVGPRVETLASERSVPRRRLRRALFAVGLGLALLATLQPVFGAKVPEEGWRGVDVVVALDVSRSMLARDVAPDRLGLARKEIRALAGRARGDRLALVAFAGEARVLVPLTSDLASFADLADLADPTVVRRGGTDLGAALEASLGLLQAARGEERAILLLTDGEDLGGRGSAVARTLRERGLVVHTVGLGTALGGKIAVPSAGGETFLRDASGAEVVSALDATSLRAIAEATGGTYTDGTASPDALVAVYEDRILPLARSTFASAGSRRREDRYQWPLLAAFLLLVTDVALAGRRRR